MTGPCGALILLGMSTRIHNAIYNAHFLLGVARDTVVDLAKGHGR